MRRVAVVLCGLVLALGVAWPQGPSVAATAARPVRPQQAADPAMQVHLVRSAEPGCEPSCAEWIAAQGRIEAGSVARFRRVLSQLGDRRVPVLIDSNGGRVNEAFEIGRLARAKGLDVVVSRTLLTTCAAADKDCRRRNGAGKLRLGLPKADESKCASSCAFVLAGGARRMVGATAFVGVHQIRSFYVYAKVLRTYRVTATSKQLVSERRVTEKVVETPTPERTYDQIRSYFAEMGVGEAIMPLILSTPGDSLHWLTREELRATALATDAIDGEQLLTKAAAPASAQAPAQPTAAAVSAAAGAVGGGPAGSPLEASAPVSGFAPE